MKFSVKFKTLLLLGLAIFFFIAFFYTYALYNPKSSLNFIAEAPVEDSLFKKLVYISGEVENPGVYEFSEGMRIIDVVNIAGGFSENADSNFITNELNLSKRIKDEEKIFIPSKNSNAEVLGNNSQNQSNLININTASLSELDKLPGIGESTANKIIENRPYSNIEDLLNVSGIGESKFNEIKELISVE